MEEIKEIKEISEGKNYNSFSGYLIRTNEQEIKMLISGGQQCCECWGYFLTEDDVESFIGSDFLGLSLTDTSLNEAKMEENDVGKGQWYEGGIMFVDIKTNKGVLQFVAYNQHNGYYGHEAKVVSRDLNHIEIL